LQALTLSGEIQEIEEGDGLHDGFEFMKTIGPLAENVQQQVDFAGRLFLHGKCGCVETKKGRRHCCGAKNRKLNY
jgi:hypothetical protein